MKNLNLLTIGSKPAPGQLLVIQGLVNTFNVESGEDEIGTRELLKAWLVCHGLMRSDADVTSQDLRTALSLREALRHLLLANNGQTVEPASIRQINTLTSRLKLDIHFKPDASLSLSPGSDGFDGVCEQILALIVQAVNDGTWYRLKACHESNCRWVFYDASKNHSGRWCSMTVCGSRDKARAFRKRRSGQKWKNEGR